MDPRAFYHWPWNQKGELECPQDLAHSEIYHEFFVNKKDVVVEIPRCLDGFVWTGLRFVTRDTDDITWYPLGIIVPHNEILLHTIFVQYGKWNIIPISFTPEYIDVVGHPTLKLQFPKELSGKIELLAQKLS